MLGPLAMISKVASFGRTNNKLLSALKSQGGELLSISESFVERGQKLDKIYSFFEQEKLYGAIVCTFEFEIQLLTNAIGCPQVLCANRARERRTCSNGLQPFLHLQVFESRE
jgi:hypothetical protein